MKCRTYWASHGCDREQGHVGPHICGFDDPDGLCSIWDRGRLFYVQNDENGGITGFSEPYETEGYGEDVQVKEA